MKNDFVRIGADDFRGKRCRKNDNERGMKDGLSGLSGLLWIGVSFWGGKGKRCSRAASNATLGVGIVGGNCGWDLLVICW